MYKLIEFALIIALPTILLSLMRFIAQRKLIFVDLFGLSYLSGYVLAFMILRLTDWIDFSKTEIVQLDLIMGLFYVVFHGLLTSNFFFNFIARGLLYVSIQSFQVALRVKDGETDLVGMILIRTCGWIVFEIIFYVQQKGQAKIFLSNLKIKQQQKQLLNVLDTVPDKVLICSQKIEG